MSDPIKEARIELIQAQVNLQYIIVENCPARDEHLAVQHRDLREPWCPHCRRTDRGWLIPAPGATS